MGIIIVILTIVIIFQNCKKSKKDATPSVIELRELQYNIQRTPF